MLKTVMLILSLFLSAQAFACSCIPQPKDINIAVSRSYELASAVVLAKAVKIDGGIKKLVDELVYGGIHQNTQFSTIHHWKGSPGDRFATHTNTSSAACGYSFQPGETYLLYLTGPDASGNYSTSSCSRTKPLNAAVVDLDVLNVLAPGHFFETKAESPVESQEILQVDSLFPNFVQLQANSRRIDLLGNIKVPDYP